MRTEVIKALLKVMERSKNVCLCVPLECTGGVLLWLVGQGEPKDLQYRSSWPEQGEKPDVAAGLFVSYGQGEVH